MAETFNPYAEWLGVRSASAQPNHYELLRLEPLESNPDVILTAANMQMAKVRGVRPGEHMEEWRRVLDELGVAKRCLTDFIEKSQYDAALREKGWPGSASNSTTPSAGDTGEKRSPYMEVTNVGVSNPLPPQIGAGKGVGANSPGGSASGGNVSGGSGIGRKTNSGSAGSGQPANAPAWQPGTNLLPPVPRVSPDAAIANKADTPASPQNTTPQGGSPANGWIPASTADKAWTPPSPQADKEPHAPVVPFLPTLPGPSSTASNPPSAASPSPPAPKPKLQFPGETVPVAPAPVPPPAAPIPPTSAPGFPAPGPAFPAGLPQLGGAFNQFPRPFPPMPGMPLQGPISPNAAPPNVMPPQPMPQQPFAGQFFPGGPMRPGVNPQFPQFAPGAPGTPNYFPHPPAGSPYAPMPMPPPGGMPGYYPQQGAMPGFAGNFPPQGMPPQAMPPQAMMPQPTMPQPAAPAAGGNFLDDVLSGPGRGGRSPMDELGFGDSPAAPQPAGGWQPDHFSQPAPAAADPGGFRQVAPPPPMMQADYDPSTADSIGRPRSASRQQQGSRTMLIGGALAAVVLLAALLVVAVILRQKDAAVVVNEPKGNGSQESSISPQHPSTPKTTPASNDSGHDAPNSKTQGPAVQPKTAPPNKPPAETSTKDPSDTMPAPPNPAVKPPGEKPPSRPAALVVQPDPTKPTPAKPPAVDPAKAARLTRLLAETRHKLAERNQDEATRLIAEATPLAVTPEQTDRVQRMAALVRYVGEFWGAVHDALGGLKPTDEIDLGSDKAVVVEKDDQSLTIRMAGGNRRISVREMPSGVAVALANRWLDPSKPENKVFIGAFYAVDPKHVPDDAKQLWNEAAAAGVSDGTYLLPLLNPEPAAAETTGADMDALPPVPDAKAVDRVTLKVKEEFDDAILAATTPTKLGELVQKLFDAADSSDDLVRKYVLCVEARDLAVKGGRAKLTIDAIDRIAKDFRVDALDMKADTFSNYPPTTAAGGREVTHAALGLAEEAVSVKRIALATRFAQVAVAAAQVSGGNALLKQATQRSKEIEALAGKKMASDPN